MKNLLLLLVLTFATVSQAQTIAFGDVRLKNKLLYSDVTNATAKDVNGNQIKIDANGNNEIEVSEAQAVYQLDLNVVQTVLANTYNSVAGLENFVNLRKLVMHFYYNPSISFAAFPFLEDLSFTGSSQTNSLSLAGIPNLKRLNISDNTYINNLDFSTVPQLEYLKCNFLGLTSLNVSMLTQLKELVCPNNRLTTLNLTGLTQLTKLDCNENRLVSLNLSGNPLLQYVDCSKNYTALTSLNITGLTQLTYLNCSYNKIGTLNVATSPGLQYLYAQSNDYTSLNLSGFQNLLELDCTQPQYSELFTSLNLTGCVSLRKLTVGGTKITSLNLTAMPNLEYLNIDSNIFITTLNISGLSRLKDILMKRTTALTNFTFTELPALETINFENSAISRLDLEHSPLLGGIYGDNSAVTFVNVSNSTSLYSLNLNSCPNLKTLLLKNGRSSGDGANYYFISPSLEYLCVDEDKFTYYQQLLTSFGITQCQINSYCSFHPGGTYYEITGTNRIDTGANGCSTADPVYPNLKLRIANGSNIGFLVTRADGSFSIPVQTGNNVITPVLENTNYFTASPASATVNFNTATSPYNLSFCLTPAGNKTDVQIMMMPITAARPGFDATYKLIYKNKGNQVENGTINLAFPDNSIDLVSAAPAAISSNGMLAWNFTNLNPMETREITLVFNVNSPMEIPAVINGDILYYTASIATANTDIDMYNNTFTLNQTVVGSYDPNDKTCLEGTAVPVTAVGKYVHYLIRFENTGTYPAENVVVTDMIDATKFEINTLEPISGSHPYITRIKGQKVEFIFENINLPFSDATNDGYIMFKIKTKTNLGVGSTFTNEAKIYFDYNLPIVTNLASTSIALLGRPDFNFEDYFKLYPNPTKNRINIEIKDGLGLSSLEIYSFDGKVIMAVPQPTTTLDVSSLAAGAYFIKVHTEKGSATTKFIKQ
jgi:conserved repeat domain